MIILYVHGDMEYAALTVKENYNAQEIYNRMKQLGINETEVEKGLYAEIKDFPFTELSEGFKEFLDTYIAGENGSESNFFIVED